MRSKTTLLSCLLLLFAAQGVNAQRFHDSDPMLVDNDRLVDVTVKPEYIELSDVYDRIGHIFGDIGLKQSSEAQNVNTLDEVPNSSWFTNRHGAKRMSMEELRLGPDSRPPRTDETWTIFKGKSQGLTPGFQIIDGRGDKFVIKLDPVGIPELSTAAEVIGTKIFGLVRRIVGHLTGL